MSGFTTRLAQHALGHLRTRLRNGLTSDSPGRMRTEAVLTGAALGAVVHGLATAADGSGEPAFRLAMALVVVAAGSAAFVLYAVHRLGARTGDGVAARHVRVRTCIGLLGGGLVATSHVLQRLAA